MDAGSGGVYRRLALTLIVPIVALLLARIPLPGINGDANPRWRVWRLGGYLEREHLWARIKVVALVLVLIQGFFIARWVRSTASSFPFTAGWAKSSQRNRRSDLDRPLIRAIATVT